MCAVVSGCVETLTTTEPADAGRAAAGAADRDQQHVLGLRGLDLRPVLPFALDVRALVDRCVHGAVADEDDRLSADAGLAAERDVARGQLELVDGVARE